MIISVKHALEQDINALADRRPECTTESLESFHDVLVKKPWGCEYLIFENNDVAIWILEIKPGQQTSMHCHPKKNTSLIVLGGQAVCGTLKQQYPLSARQGMYLGKKVFHQSANPGNETIVMMEIESPIDKYDLVRLEDGYGRVDCGYENSEACSHQSGLSLNSDLLKKNPINHHFGESRLTIGYANDIRELYEKIRRIDLGILTILDRHVWTSEGKKFYEVGQAFNFSSEQPIIDLNINAGFHYLSISP